MFGWVPWCLGGQGREEGQRCWGYSEEGVIQELGVLPGLLPAGSAAEEPVELLQLPQPQGKASPAQRSQNPSAQASGMQVPASGGASPCATKPPRAGPELPGQRGGDRGIPATRCARQRLGHGRQLLAQRGSAAPHPRCPHQRPRGPGDQSRPFPAALPVPGGRH